ncbi:hypothetical protein SAMN04487970_102838 [Paenibacillus tianmuensis]|uniref:Uncharacterized protein n=2 Tax=Paenibacillus tianmuensis TaxID=624147 RepID=A0A1G4SGR5_9BACL|nr:hypothetical protein SAMN04487970_102838 [Paenibacillus tianmuensis]
MIYIAHGIIMAVIEFALDEHGQQPVLNHLNMLRAQAQAGDLDALWILPRITRAMSFVSRHGIPDSLDKLLSDTDDNGVAFTLAKPVKELVHHHPLLELRVNRQGYGAFRAIFFVHKHEGQQILVFTRSILKQSKSSIAFDIVVHETEAMFSDFKINPGKYINL